MNTNSNILNKITISDNLYALKIKNPVFNPYYAPHFMETSRYEGGDPVVTHFLTDSDKKTFDGTVLFLDTTGRYLHDMVENIPIIVALLSQGEKFKVALVADNFIDPKTLLFEGMLEGPNDAGKISQPCKYLIDFFKFFNLEFFCLNDREFLNYSCDFSYVFYQKNRVGDKQEYVDAYSAAGDDGAYDKRMLENAETWPFHNYPILKKNSDYLKPYSIPDFLLPEEGFYMRSHSWLWDAVDYQHNIDLLREYLPRTKVIPGTKIFLSRKNYGDRKLSSENSLEIYFTNLGYEIVCLEEYDAVEQLELVQSSEYVVGMIGSAFVNTLLDGVENKVLIFRPEGEYNTSMFSDTYDKYNVKYVVMSVRNDSSYIINQLEVLKDFMNVVK